MSSSAKVKKVKKVYTEEGKKRTRNIILISVASAVAAILIVGIILGCVKTSGFSALEGYKYVSINGNAASVMNLTSETEENKDAFAMDSRLKEGLKKSKYSILRGIFEGAGANAYKFEMQDVEYREKNKKGEWKTKTRKERVVIKSADIESQATSGENSYSLVFDFGRDDNGNPAKTIKVEGEDIAYDTARIAVSASSDNIIEKYVIYFYDSEKIYGDGSEYYEISPVVVKANASNLYNGIKAILDYGKNNGF